MQPEILFEDTDLLVLSKPAGVVVNEAQTLSEPTLQQWARQHLEEWATEGLQESVGWQALVPANFDENYGSPEEVFTVRAGMVHRIDRETSGVLVWAKNPGSLVNLLAQFKNRTVQKTYQAVVHGFVQPKMGEITAPIGRIPWKRGLFGVLASGRPAVTEYQVVQTLTLDTQELVSRAKASGLFKGQSVDQVAANQGDYFQYSLVQCYPKTGRTHQIRVHFQHLKHPLVGDVLYQGNKRQKLDALWCPRHFLHAATLKLTHPRSGEVMEFAAPLPPDLETALSLLRET